MIDLEQELLKFLLENKSQIAMALIFFFHSFAIYYVKPGKKSLKGLIKHLVLKNEA